QEPKPPLRVALHVPTLGQVEQPKDGSEDVVVREGLVRRHAWQKVLGVSIPRGLEHRRLKPRDDWLELGSGALAQGQGSQRFVEVGGPRRADTRGVSRGTRAAGQFAGSYRTERLRRRDEVRWRVRQLTPLVGRRDDELPHGATGRLLDGRPVSLMDV